MASWAEISEDDAMLKRQLRIKYRLESSEPSALQVACWRSRAKSLTRFGLSCEKAGRMAAKEVFQSFGSNFLPRQTAEPEPSASQLLSLSNGSRLLRSSSLESV